MAAYNWSNFGHAEKRLFNLNNYKYFIGTICPPSGNHHHEPEALAFQNQNSCIKATYDPDPYLLQGQGFLWYTALMRPWIHANAIYICLTIADPRMCQQLCILEDNIFTYGKCYLLLWNAAYKVGANHSDIELLCYIWHAIAGPIWHYIDNFLALYLILNLCHTVSDDLQWHSEYHTYLASECSPNTGFINMTG